MNGHSLYVNHNAFDELNDESEYWIGLLAADGSIVNTPHGYRIQLYLIDVEHVKKFKTFMKSEHKVSISSTRGHASIKFMSDAIGNKLIEYGITPNKSLDLQIKNARLLASRHFWRGVIDGDGHISLATRSKSIGLTSGSFEFIKQFRDYVDTILCNKIKLTNIAPHGDCYCIALYAAKARRIIIELYDNINEDIVLNRKLDKAIEVIYAE